MSENTQFSKLYTISCRYLKPLQSMQFVKSMVLQPAYSVDGLLNFIEVWNIKELKLPRMP